MPENKIKKIFSFNTPITVDDIQEVNDYLYHHRNEFTKLAGKHLKANLETVKDSGLLVKSAIAVFHSLKENSPLAYQLLRIIRSAPISEGLVSKFIADLFLQLYTSGEFNLGHQGLLNLELITAATYKSEVADHLVKFYHSCPLELKKNTLYILVSIPNLMSEHVSFVKQEVIKALDSNDKELERVGIRYLSALNPSEASLITLGIPFLLKYKTYDDVYNDYGLKLSKVKQLSDADLKTLMKAVPTLPLATHVKDPYMHHNCGSQLEEQVDKLLVKKNKWDAVDWRYIEKRKRGYYRFLLPSLYFRYEENPNKATIILKRILEGTKTYTMHEEQLGTSKDILTFLAAKQQIDKQVVDVVFYILLNNKGLVTEDIAFYLKILKNYPDLRTYIEPLAQLIENYRSSRLYSALLNELIETATPANSTLRSNLLQQI